MRSYAEGELQALRAKEEAEGESLRDLLYDRKAGAMHAAVILEIRAGTGGDEACLFARDLYEMYRRFAERMGWKFEVLDMEATELGGFREVSFSLSGETAFRHISISKAADIASSAYPKPKPRAAFTLRPRPSSSCPSPKKSTS